MRSGRHRQPPSHVDPTRDPCLADNRRLHRVFPRPRTAPSPEAYREAVTAFYVGLSAMQTTQEVLAREKFDRVVALVPQEPAGWANLGLLLLRQQDLEQGAQQLAQAADAGARQRRRFSGCRRSPRAGAATSPRRSRHWRRALELDPARSRRRPTRWRSRPSGRADADNDAEAQRVLEQLVARREQSRGASRVRCASPPSAAIRRRSTPALAPLAGRVARVVAAGAGAAEDADCRGRRRTRERGDARRVPEERPAARAGLSRARLPRSPRRATEVAGRSMRFLRLKNPDPAAGARRRGADVRGRARRRTRAPARPGPARSR